MVTLQIEQTKEKSVGKERTRTAWQTPQFRKIELANETERRTGFGRDGSTSGGMTLS